MTARVGAVLLAPLLGLAQPADAEVSADTIAVELSNPATALRSLAIDYDRTVYQGDLPGIDGETTNDIFLSGSWPFRLDNGKNVFLDVDVPVRGSQPNWTSGYLFDYAEFLVRQLPETTFDTGGFAKGHGHIGDIAIAVGYGGVSERGLIARFDLETRLPTSTDSSVARDQFLLGPAVSLGKLADWGLLAATAKHLTNVSSDGEYYVRDSQLGDYFFTAGTNETTLEINFAYALRNGWQVESNPVALYDWEAVSGNEWLVPLGLGASKTFRLGGTYVKFAAELQKYVVTPDRIGPDWMFRFSLIPVLSTKLL